MASRPRRRILVINPNSNEIVTRGLAEALAPIRFADGPQIECRTLAEGPYGIETQEHVESVTLPLRSLVAGSNGVDAFVIACYSDPGLHVCREATDRPVFGMSVAETASGEGTLARMIEVGRQLREEDGADVIVMGCAGMARHRKPLEAALGVPVVDPTQAAVAMAVGAVQFADG